MTQDDHFFPRDTCDLDEPVRPEPKYEDMPRLLRPYVHVYETRTRGWQVRYHTPRSDTPIIVARGLSEDQARTVGQARAAVQDCPLVVGGS